MGNPRDVENCVSEHAKGEGKNLKNNNYNKVRWHMIYKILEVIDRNIKK